MGKLWDNFKQPKIYVTRVSQIEGERRKIEENLA